MDISTFFKAIVDSDAAHIVVCDMSHKIVYMNPAAIQRFSKRGGAALIGTSIFACHNERSNDLIKRVADWFGESPENNRMFTFSSEKENKDVYMIALRDDSGKLIGYYEKHEYRSHETALPYAPLRDDK